MIRELLIIAMMTTVFFTACNQQENRNAKNAVAPDNIVTQTSTDKEGNKLDMSFDNAKDIVTITFRGDTAELASQKPASGIWYKNDHYELSGKGSNYELLKDGKTVFKN